MIAKLAGILDRLYEDAILIDVRGVGYRVLVSKRCLYSMPQQGKEITLWTETIIRNEQPCLCGFLEESEADWFRILTQVQGVGAKVALSLLSSLTPSELYEAISTQKSTMLAKADGVGPKLASRIVLELKGKKDLPIASFNNTPGMIEAAVPISHHNDITEDALSALVNLGYNKNEAKEAINKALLKNPESPSLEHLIKIALQEFKRYA